MSHTIETSVAIKYELALELSDRGIGMVVFQDGVDEEILSGELTIEQLIENEVDYNSCAGKLLDNGAADLLQYRDMLMRGIVAIDEAIQKAQQVKHESTCEADLL